MSDQNLYIIEEDDGFHLCRSYDVLITDRLSNMGCCRRRVHYWQDEQESAEEKLAKWSDLCEEQVNGLRPGK